MGTMKKSEIIGVNIRSIQSNEIEKVLQLIKVAFTHYNQQPDENNGVEHYDMFREVYRRKDLDLDLIIVAERDGEFISVASFLPKKMTCSGKEMKGVILSPVATVPSYRGHGLAEQVITFGLDVAKQKEYLLSLVLGHPDYYPRVGYVPVFPWYHVEIGLSPSDIVRKETPSVKVRDVTFEDIDCLVSMYGQETETCIISPVRTREWFHQELSIMNEPTDSPRRKGHIYQDRTDFRVFTREDKVIGYAYLSEEGTKLKILECYTKKFDDMDDIYQRLVEIAIQRNKTNLASPLPPIHHFGIYMKQRVDKQTTYSPSALMLQVLDWEACLSIYFDEHDLGDQQQMIEYSHNMAPYQFTRLFMGLYNTTEIAVHFPNFTTQQVRTLSQLFPKRDPYFNIGDMLF